MFKPLIIIGLSFAFIGCASTNSNNAANASQESQKVAKKDDDKPKYVCKKVHKVGTNFKQTKCWPLEEYAEKRDADKEALRQLQRSTIAPPESR
ncbi:hypothetical protein DZA50_03015 [Kangiella sp. HD9-110m-PIT-SAG07]|nr:hypothetical protein DZA50_03015 [Kangiella sp. HD9-110m-PIT-SAG07]